MKGTAAIRNQNKRNTVFNVITSIVGEKRKFTTDEIKIKLEEEQKYLMRKQLGKIIGGYPNIQYSDGGWRVVK